MANTNNTRKTFTNLSDPQQIRELNRQMEWLWHQLLGGLTDKAFSDAAVRRIVTKTEEIIATDLNVDSIYSDRLKTALAQIVVAQIAVATVDFEAVADLVAEALILEKGVADSVYVRNLLVTSANMLNAVIGKLVLKGTDGEYYDVSIGSDGTIYTERTELTSEEISAGVTTDGKQILQDSVNAETIAGQTVYGNEALFNTLLVGALNAGKITAADALMASATIPMLYVTSIKALGDTLDISANDSITFVVGGLEDVQSAASTAQAAASAAQQDIDNLSVGGRNFVRNSEALRSLTRNMTKNTSYSWNPDPQWLLSDYAKAILNADDYPETLIVSFDGKASKGGCKFGISVRTDTNGIGYMSVAALVKSANTWVRYSIPLTRNSGSDDYVLTHLRANLTAPSDGSATFEIRRMKLEIGNRSTDWTPAPEDTDADITAAQTTANGAASAASNAQSTADGAASAASAAQSAANTAQSTANGAASAASAAQTTANGAASAASAAQSTADGAVTAAGAAQSTADSAASAASAAQATADAKADPMTATVHGSEIVVSDSADAAIGGLVLYGKSEQGGQTIGKNLLPFSVNTPVAPNGVTISILPDGGVKIVGTTTAQATYMFHADYSALNLPAGTYRFLLPGSGTGYGGSNVLLQLYADLGDGQGRKSQLTTVDGTFTIPATTVDDYVRLRIANGVTYDCVVYPMVMLSSNSDTTFEPYTGGTPAPNPLFPCPLESAGMTSGKNLLRDLRGGTTSGGVTFTPQADGGIRISGTASATVQYNPYTDYTIMNIPHGMYRIRISGTGTGAENVRVQMYEDRGSGLAVASAWNNEDYICIVRDDVVANTIRIRVAAGTYDCVVYPMVLPAYTDDTSFEAYSGGPVGTQIVLTCADDAQGTNAAHTALPTPNGLPGIAVSSGGNYTDADGQQWICDTIDLAAGTYTKRVGQYTFNGSETGWRQSSTMGTGVTGKYRYVNEDFISTFVKPADNATPINAMCDTYLIVPISTSNNSGILFGEQGIGVSRAGVMSVYDARYGTDGTNGFANWKAMLAARPMHCLFALATPVVTPLTEAQLTALRSIRTRAGVTVLTNDADTDMDLTYATRTGGGSYVEGVRQGLDDGIGKAQNAADAAQATADAAREDFRRVVRIDTEGLHVGDNQTSNEVMIDSESVNVVLGGKKYSKFAGDYVQFGDYQLRRSVDGGLVFKKA